MREKWTWLALGLLSGFVALALVDIRVRQLTDRVQRLERYLPYLEPPGLK